MEKVLRSLIQEKFPLDVRVRIELLSRKRGKEDKQDELFKILRESGIEGITSLGPGTNRYAFRLEGFVIKVATDHDGKIDNLKEFRMAKILYPYVAKTYEVSDNGTLLVAEYIQPFVSYSEMLKYADQIRDILKKISSVYLIGDVGITSKNFVNWGIRVGTDDPVCLDFAYVYEISSELFVCKKCKAGAMLIPDNDFTTLYCSNKGCNKETTFEDIRTRIGNDIHRHEIGDLSKIGYKMNGSNILTTLTEDRSGYLKIKKKDSKKKEIQNEVEKPFIDDFVMDKPAIVYIKEEKKMGKIMSDAVEAVATIPYKETRRRQIVVPAKEVLIKDKTEEVPIPITEEQVEVKGTVVNGTVEPKNGNTLFSGKIKQQQKSVKDQGIKGETSERKPVKPQPAVPVESSVEPPVEDTTTTQEEVPTTETEEPTVVKATEVVVSQKTPKADKPDKNASTNGILTDRFMNNIQRAVSTTSNRIGDYTHFRLLFDSVKGHIKDKKMYPETFYKNVQNAIYHAFVTFLNLKKEQKPNANNNGTHTELQLQDPDNVKNNKFINTLIFIDRFWSSNELNQMENFDELMAKFKSKYPDCYGIQKEFIPAFKQRLKYKMASIDNTGVNMVASAIEEFWCVDEEHKIDTPVESPVEPPVEDTTTTQEEVPVEQPPLENASEDQEVEINSDDNNTDVSKINQDEYDEDGTESYQDDEEEEYEEFLNVEIHHLNDSDIIVIKSFEEFGPVTIPLYLVGSVSEQKLSSIPSIVDDRNGVWDWMVHMVPDLKFITDKPDYWLSINDHNDHIKFVILDHYNSGEYVVALFYFIGFYDVVDDIGTFIDDADLLSSLNEIIKTNIAFNDVSRYARTISLINTDPEGQLYDEEYMEAWLDKYYNEQMAREADSYYEDGDDDTGDTEEERLKKAQEAAALSVLTGNDTPVESSVEPPVEDTTTTQEEVPTTETEEPQQTSGGLKPITRRKS